MATPNEPEILEAVLRELEKGDRSFLEDMSPSEREILFGLLREFRAGEVINKGLLWELDYVEKPVDIETFVRDPYYMGLTIVESEDDNGIYRCWLDNLKNVFSPTGKVMEFILSGSIGTGKTTCAALALTYKLYQMSCLRNPQAFYGLMPDHPIVFGLYNVFKYKVDTTSYAYLESYVNGSPYFRERFPRDPRRTKQLFFPKNIRVIHGSSDLHALGENLFSVMIDETDFMKAGASDDDKGQAYELYTSTIRRMESRFMRKGGDIPGIMIMISSKTSQGSFIETRIEERRHSADSVVADHALWEVKPWRYAGPTFPVFVGDQYSDPKILSDEEAEKFTAEGRVIQVPTEHKSAFVEDIEGALRDIAGVATVSDIPFIPSRENIHGCVDKERTHPFTKAEFSVTIHDDHEIEDFFIPTSILKVRRSEFEPKIRPGVNRYIHLDLGVTNDAVGIAMGHISGMRTVTRASTDPTADGFEYQVRVPEIYIDLMLRVVPTPGSRIEFQKIRNFIYALQRFGFPIAHVSLDGWQSEDGMQQFIKQGFEADILSMDRSPKEKDGHPYSYLRQAILENRISYYHYDTFLAEAINLQKIVLETKAMNPYLRWKVDHPAQMLDLQGRKVRGSKDVCDAVGGVVRQCMVLDPAAQEQGLPVKGTPSPKPAGAVAQPSFVQNDEWLMGDDYGDTGRIQGIQG